MQEKYQHEYVLLLTAQRAQSHSELHDTEPKKMRVKQTPQGHRFAQGKSPGNTNIC